VLLLQSFLKQYDLDLIYVIEKRFYFLSPLHRYSDMNNTAILLDIVIIIQGTIVPVKHFFIVIYWYEIQKVLYAVYMYLVLHCFDFDRDS